MPVLVLQDSECASSCEYALEYFKRLPNVTTVGQPSRGAYHFVSAWILSLKNSKIRIDIPTGAVGRLDGRIVERVGIAPDVSVEAGADAMAKAKELATSLSPVTFGSGAR